MSATTVDAARWYVRHGWAPVPIPHEGKYPRGISGWEDLRLTERALPTFFNGRPQNIGILLGEPSGGLLDVDLDCREAIFLAPRFLPATEAVFGRASAPASHWEYLVADAWRLFAWRDPRKPKNDEHGKLIELRGSGHQTVFPPSTHESGEPITWVNKDKTPATASLRELRACIGKLAAASLLARYWPASGSRQDAALALGGGLIRAGWDEEAATAFVEAVAAAAGDEETASRARSVAYSARAAGADRHITGWPTLATLIGDDVVDAARDWLGMRDTPNNPNRRTDENARTDAAAAENVNAPPAVESFPVRVLPPTVRTFVTSASDSIGCPVEYVAVPLLGLAEGCIGKSRRLVIRPGFEVSPGSWYGVVGESGTGKSPALKRALQAIRPLQDEAWQTYLDKLAAWEALAKEERGDKPAPEHFFITDSTGEALWAALASSPGVAQVEDELRRRLKALDAYRQAGDRQAMLAMWSNAPVKIVRRTSAPVYVPFPVAPLIGSIQPGVLQHLRGEGEDANADDGWVPRFLLCWPDADPLDLSDVPFDETTQPPVVQIFRRLRLYNNEPYDTVLSSAAFARFREWHGDNRYTQMDARGFERQWAAKAPTHLARLALVLHLFAEPSARERVSIETMDAAIELVEFFRDHLARVLPAFGATATVRLNTRITRIIRMEEQKAKDGWVARTTLLDKLRNVASAALTAALRALEAGGRLESRQFTTKTKPREEWRIAPKQARNHAGGDSGFSGYSVEAGENPNNPNARTDECEWEKWTV